MMFPTRTIDPNDHVLIVLGHNGHPTFKTISTDEGYLKKLGESMVSNKHSHFQSHQVISSHNVFTLTNPDYTFDQALDQIIRDLLLKPRSKL